MRDTARAIAAALLLLPMLGAPALAEDAREAAVRTPAERDFILGQMRLFLQSTQAITAALARGDLQTVADEARARGRTGTPASAIPPGMRAKEPPAWTAMMSGARAGFDHMAEAARKEAAPVELIGMLGDTMINCVACHQTYRLVGE